MLWWQSVRGAIYFTSGWLKTFLSRELPLIQNLNGKEAGRWRFGETTSSRGKAEADIRIWMSLFLSPENCKLLLLILPSTHIQVKFRDHCVVWHWSDIEREEKFAFFIDCILCSLDASNWSPPAIRNRRFNSSVLAQHALFSLYICHFFFLSCLFLASLSPLLSTLPFSFLPYLPFFLYSTNICEIPRVYVHDKSTIKKL